MNSFNSDSKVFENLENDFLVKVESKSEESCRTSYMSKYIFGRIQEE